MRKKVVFEDDAEMKIAIAENQGLRIESIYDHIVNIEDNGTEVREKGIIFTDEPEAAPPEPAPPKPIDPRIQAVLDDYEVRLAALEAPNKPAAPGGGA